MRIFLICQRLKEVSVDFIAELNMTFLRFGIYTANYCLIASHIIK